MLRRHRQKNRLGEPSREAEVLRTKDGRSKGIRHTGSSLWLGTDGVDDQWGQGEKRVGSRSGGIHMF